MEHIEEAGVHSGDSSCVLPPQSLSAETLRTIEDYTVRLAKALRVVGLMWGRKLKDYGFASGKLTVPQVFVKSPVFPFNKFHGVDPVLGPEMRSTGEVMGDRKSV